MARRSQKIKEWQAHRARTRAQEHRRVRDTPESSEPETTGTDTLSLSFLDVMSCGLGASIILFMVFSVMPHHGQIGSGKQEQALNTVSALESRPVGARFVELRDAVKRSDLQIIVYLKKSDPGAPELQDGSIRFTNLPSRLPRPRVGMHERMGADDKVTGYQYYMYRDGGLSPTRPIEIVVAPGTDLSAYTCVVKILVAGAPQSTMAGKEVVLPGVDDKPQTFFQVDLQDPNGMWGKQLPE